MAVSKAASTAVWMAEMACWMADLTDATAEKLADKMVAS